MYQGIAYFPSPSGGHISLQPSPFPLIEPTPPASRLPASAPLCWFTSFAHCYEEISGALVLWPPESLITGLSFNSVSVPDPHTPELSLPSEARQHWPPSWIFLCTEKEEEILCILSNVFWDERRGIIFPGVSGTGNVLFPSLGKRKKKITPRFLCRERWGGSVQPSCLMLQEWTLEIIKSLPFTHTHTHT